MLSRPLAVSLQPGAADDELQQVETRLQDLVDEMTKGQAASVRCHTP